MRDTSRRIDMALQFKYNQPKAIQVVGWFLHKHGGSINKLKLVKLVAFADREHLFRNGRPIVGGHYSALPYGPVPLEFLEALDVDPGVFLSRIEGHNLVSANEPLNEEILSQSDLEILEDVNDRLGHMDQFALSDSTHGWESWKKNYQEQSQGKKFPLSYEDFFLDAESDDMLEIIKEDQAAKNSFNS